jgi:hypothetical protein
VRAARQLQCRRVARVAMSQVCQPFGRKRTRGGSSARTWSGAWCILQIVVMSAHSTSSGAARRSMTMPNAGFVAPHPAYLKSGGRLVARIYVPSLLGRERSRDGLAMSAAKDEKDDDVLVDMVPEPSGKATPGERAKMPPKKVPRISRRAAVGAAGLLGAISLMPSPADDSIAFGASIMDPKSILNPGPPSKAAEAAAKEAKAAIEAKSVDAELRKQFMQIKKELKADLKVKSRVKLVVEHPENRY